MKNSIPSLVVFLAILLPGCSKAPTLTTHSADALRFYRDGVSLYDRFYYAEAKTALDSSLAADSAFAMAWLRLAVLYSSTGIESAARAAIEKATQLAPRATQRERLFISMWERRLRYAYNDAALVADSLIRLYPDEREAYVFRGMLYAYSKRFDAAIQMYQKAVEVDTSYALAVMMLGYAHSDAGENEEALRQMERYIRLAPDAADPRASYADLLMRVGRYKEALEQYQKSLELKHDYWYSIRSIGTVYLTQGRLTEAGQQFHKASPYPLQSVQFKASDLASDAYLEMQRGKYSDALRLYREALAVDSLNGNAAFGMVQALGKSKDFREANHVVEAIRRELERRNLTESPTMHDYYLMLARLWTEEGKLVEALAACDSALDFSTPLTRSSVYHQLAEIYLRRKLYDSALDACEEALRVNPNQPEALLTLTKVYAATGDKTMAKEIGDRLLDLWKGADPDYQNGVELRRILKMSHPPA